MRAILLALLACALGLLPACRFGDGDDVRRTDAGTLVLGRTEATVEVERVVAPGGRPLVLDGRRGAVRLTGSGDTAARLTFAKRGRGADAEAARTTAEAIEIVEDGTDEAYTFTLDPDDPDRSAVDVIGTVPRTAALRVDWTSGPLSFDGLAGPLTVESESGDVTVRGAAASVTVTTRYGDLDVRLDALPADARVRLTTLSGDVTLTLPPTASATLTAETQAGPIRTASATGDDVPFADRRLTLRGAGATFDATLGSGAATVELRTENGAVTLRTAPPPADTPATPPSPDAPDTTATPDARPTPFDTSAVPAPPPADTTTTAPPDTTAPRDTSATPGG
jgi:hypothetical protein